MKKDRYRQRETEGEGGEGSYCRYYTGEIEIIEMQVTGNQNKISFSQQHDFAHYNPVRQQHTLNGQALTVGENHVAVWTGSPVLCMS